MHHKFVKLFAISRGKRITEHGRSWGGGALISSMIGNDRGRIPPKLLVLRSHFDEAKAALAGHWGKQRIQHGHSWEMEPKEISKVPAR